MICFQLCVASPQLSSQTDRNWRESHLKRTLQLVTVEKRVYIYIEQQLRILPYKIYETQRMDR